MIEKAKMSETFTYAYNAVKRAAGREPYPATVTALIFAIDDHAAFEFAGGPDGKITVHFSDSSEATIYGATAH